MADPDGVARGGVRFNAYGYDLNRNWDSINPKTMPEIFAEHKAILGWIDAGHRIDLFLTLHNTGADYLEGHLSAGGSEMRKLGVRLASLLKQNTSFRSPHGTRDSPLIQTAGKKGRMTVYQGLFYERKIPAFLLELGVDQSPALRRLRTVDGWLAFGKSLVEVLAESVLAR
jgi:hypothetical protein